MKRWSKLKSRVESFFAPELALQLHMSVMRHQQKGAGRCWITSEKRVIWEFAADPSSPQEISEINQVLDNWTKVSSDELFTKTIHGDVFGLTPLLRVLDRRTGKRRLRTLLASVEEPLVPLVERRLATKHAE